jgi:hypothetical protein
MKTLSCFKQDLNVYVYPIIRILRIMEAKMNNQKISALATEPNLDWEIDKEWLALIIEAKKLGFTTDELHIYFTKSEWLIPKNR